MKTYQTILRRLTTTALAALFCLTLMYPAELGAATASYGHLSLRPFQYGLAGQTTQSMPVQAGAAVNPALLGYGEQNTFFAGAMLGPGLTGFYADSALFSPFGGLMLSAEYLEAGDRTAALSFGYGSFLSRRIATGLSITPRYTNAGTAQAFGLGLDPALLFDSKWHTSFTGNDGFGLYSPSVFFRTQNLAIPIGDDTLLASPSAHVGLMSGLYQSSTFNLALIASTYGTERFDRLPLLAGVQAQYRWAMLSLGYGTSNFQPVANGFHLGVGAMLPFEFGDTFLFYSVGFANSGRSDLHSFTAGVRLGGVDRDAPEVSVESEGSYFSPNNDGTRDLMSFQATVRDKSPIVFYEFRILDSKGAQVFRQRADERIREKDFSWSLFMRSFIAPRARSDVPERFTWNGRVMAEKKKAVKDNIFEDETPDQALPDGAYTWQFRVIDEKNNESRTASGEVIIDTKAPTAVIETGDDLISPNGDGQRDILPLTQDVTASDSYEAAVVNAQGEKIRTWKWENNAPTRLDFDGRKDNGELAEEGGYRYQLTGRDAAGNHASATSGNFYISRRVDAVFLKSSVLALNPANPAHAQVTFEPSVAFGDGYLDGEIIITSQCSKRAEDIVFRIPVTNLKPLDAKKTGKKEKSAPFSWAGQATATARLSDGVYCAQFRARYQNGNSPESPALRLSVDTTGPEAEVSADLSVRQFSPDGDGENEEQAFRLYVHDQSQTETYTLTISEVAPDAKGVKLIPVRHFSGTGEVPQTIYWDGKTESGGLIDSLTQYEYTLKVTDALGNTTTTAPRRFESAVLAVPSGSGFLVRLPYANLEDPVTDRLENVYKLLNKYPKYKIKIEAHTAIQGGIEQNLKVSENAARKVATFLIEKGIPAERVSYQGFGDSMPAYNARGVYAGKNRRIDILLSR